VGAVVVIVLAACTSARAAPIAGGDADRGAQTIALMGCGSCHHIPGVPGASGLVGPPLDNVAERGMLAGELPNTPDNMVRWIRDPQSVEPNTAMPNLEIGDQSARDIVAYLYSIH
jgi:cytochrome c1